ncbi:MAG TPA: hypothetical protein DCW29_10515 [Janthinobacterium sp.]|nr:hypothetical protein [Janthinobacterium sp.]
MAIKPPQRATALLKSGATPVWPAANASEARQSVPAPAPATVKPQVRTARPTLARAAPGQSSAMPAPPALPASSGR